MGWTCKGVLRTVRAAAAAADAGSDAPVPASGKSGGAVLENGSGDAHNRSHWDHRAHCGAQQNRGVAAGASGSKAVDAAGSAEAFLHLRESREGEGVHNPDGVHCAAVDQEGSMISGTETGEKSHAAGGARDQQRCPASILQMKTRSLARRQNGGEGGCGHCQSHNLHSVAVAGAGGEGSWAQRPSPVIHKSLRPPQRTEGHHSKEGVSSPH